jgi:Fe2+ transport system protein B
VALFLYNVAGRQGDCYILPILEGSASIARDCKRDIYSRFLHINLHIYIYIHIHSHTHSSINSIHSCTSVITSYHLYTCNRLLLHLIIVYPLLVCVLLYYFMFTYAFASCFIAWFPGIVPVGFLLAEVRPPTIISIVFLL